MHETSTQRVKKRIILRAETESRVHSSLAVEDREVENQGGDTRKATIEKGNEQSDVLQNWAAHIKYPKGLARHRPTVDTGLFKTGAQLAWE